MTGTQVCAGTGGLICGWRGRPEEGRGLGIRKEGRRRTLERVKEEGRTGTRGDDKTTFVFHFAFGGLR